MDVVWRPGTRGSLVLRVSQLVCAAASLVAIVTSNNYLSYSAFFYLSWSMFLQLLESFLLACVDIVCLATNSDLRDIIFVSIILISDWCIGIMSFSAATASAGVIVLFKRDTEFCRAFPQLTCDQYEISGHLSVHGMVIHSCICSFLVLVPGFFRGVVSS
ncbi:hypothetical protein EJB05_44525, partial [Eragrostis curvula]